MEKVKFYKCEKAITEIDLINIEKRLKTQLPEDFKTHYLKFNGGEPEKTLWIDKDNRFENIEIRDFISLLYNQDFKDDPAFSLPERVIEEWENKEVPVNLIPFAMDWLGNYICINKKDHKIHYFDRDKEPETDVLICSSFQNFIENLNEVIDKKTDFENVQHEFWGNVEESWEGIVTDKQFKISYFQEKDFSILLGEELDEDGEEIAVLPAKKQLDNFQKTFRSFLENIDTVIVAIKEKAFERYQKLYSAYYEDSNKSGQEPLNIATEDKHFEYMKNILNVRILKRNTLIISISYDLDTEHGLEFKIKNNKIVVVGGIAET